MSDPNNPPSGNDPYGNPEQGMPQYGQPQYGQPQYGQPQYGGQEQYGQAYGAYGSGPQGPKPSNNLVWGILTTLFCCLPLGIVSIVFAAKVDGLWNSGQYAAAEDAAKKAKTWALVSAGLGLVVVVLYVILFAAGALTASSTTY